MVPSTCSAKQISGGQREEGHGVVHHVQGEHYQRKVLRVRVREAFIKKKKKIREIFHRWGGGVKPKKFHGFKSDV